MEITIKLDRQHTMFLDLHNWVKVGNYILVKESKGEYYLTKIVDDNWTMEVDAMQTKVIVEEEN